MMQTSIPVIVLAPGEACEGSLLDCNVVTVDPQGASGRILMIDRLKPEHYPLIRAAKGAVVKDGAVADHASVISRIMRKPHLLLPAGSLPLADGQVVTLDPGRSQVHIGSVPVPQREYTAGELYLGSIRGRRFRIQASVVSAAEIAEANAPKRGFPEVSEFFLRSELLWLSEGILNPFQYLKRAGASTVKMLLKDRLRRCLRQMTSSQILNFRSLDMRSDEFPVGDEHVERNPELGFHGIRRSLKDPRLLCAELRALAELKSEGYNNIVFSLPFINDREELDLVNAIAENQLARNVRLGVFVETPAAITELGSFIDRGVSRVYIGTKDLTQSILACDRTNASVAHIYDPRSRPVVDAISRIVRTARARKVGVVLFSMLGHVPFFAERFPHLDGFSLCCGEYQLAAAASVSDRQKGDHFTGPSPADTSKVLEAVS